VRVHNGRVLVNPAGPTFVSYRQSSLLSWHIRRW
jgi:hypothetical protein